MCPATLTPPNPKNKAEKKKNKKEEKKKWLDVIC